MQANNKDLNQNIEKNILPLTTDGWVDNNDVQRKPYDIIWNHAITWEHQNHISGDIKLSLIIATGQHKKS